MSQRRRAAHVVALVAVAGLVVASHVPTCPFAIVTRIPCPGCGMTRAAMAMAHGDLAGAWRLHPLSFVGVPLVGALAAQAAFTYVRGGAASTFMTTRSRAFTLVAAALGLALVGVWVARFLGALGGPVPL